MKRRIAAAILIIGTALGLTAVTAASAHTQAAPPSAVYYHA